jgi:hypothetical protein
MPRLGLGVLLVAASLAALISGCSSDEFSPTGTSLPADVSQDSLLVPLDIVGTIGETRLDMPILDPPQGESSCASSCTSGRLWPSIGWPRPSYGTTSVG